MKLAFLAVLSAGLVAHSTAFAQTVPSTSARDRPWSISADLFGFTSGGPARDIENAMRAAHFGDTLPAFISGPTPTPFSGTTCGAVFIPVGCGGAGNFPAIEVDHVLTDAWSLGAFFSPARGGFWICERSTTSSVTWR